MKKKVVIIILIVIALIITTLYIINVLNTNFTNLSDKIEQIYNDKSDDIVVAYVNDDPIYLNDVRLRYYIEVAINTEKVESYKIKRDKQTNELLKMLYQKEIDEAKNIVVSPSDILDKLIVSILIDKDIKAYNLALSDKEKSKLRKNLIESNKRLEEQIAKGDEDALSTKKFNDITSIGLKEELFDNQLKGWIHWEIETKYKTIIIEKEFGKGSFKLFDEEQNDYFKKHCEKLRRNAEIEIVKQVNERIMD